MEDKFRFAGMIQRLQEAKVDLPHVLAESGQRYFAKNYDKQQWNGTAWQPRVRETKKSAGKPIGVSSGFLRSRMDDTIWEYNYKEVVWQVGVPYAKYFNFGKDKMVARQIMGGDKEFLHLMKARIVFQFNKVFHK